jgi:hypothetical protein
MKVYLIEKTAEKPIITTNRTTAARIIKAMLDEEEVYEWLTLWDIEAIIEHDSHTDERSAWYITSHFGVTCEVIEVIEG